METFHPLMQVTPENLGPDPSIEAHMQQVPEGMGDDARHAYRTSLAVDEILRQRAEADPDAEGLVDMHRDAKDNVRQQQAEYGIFDPPPQSPQAPQDHPR